MRKPELLDRDVIYEGKLITVRRDQLRQGDQIVEREVVAHPDSVAIVAVNERDEVLLIRQYRHPIGDFLWELPAGLLDQPDEDPLAAAARELSEEAGITARAGIGSSPCIPRRACPTRWSRSIWPRT